MDEIEEGGGIREGLLDFVRRSISCCYFYSVYHRGIPLREVSMERAEERPLRLKLIVIVSN